MALDPVCGMTWIRPRGGEAFEHKGKHLHFCFAALPARVQRRPRDSICRQRAGTRSPQRKGQVHLPMHPEIVQIGPGSCPKVPA